MIKTRFPLATVENVRNMLIKGRCFFHISTEFLNLGGTAGRSASEY